MNSMIRKVIKQGHNTLTITLPSDWSKKFNLNAGSEVELNEKDSLITLFGDNDFQLDQIKDILLPGMEKKEPDSSKRLEHKDVQKVSGNKVKQELKIRDGIDQDLAKRIVKLVKDSGLKVQASIQGETVRINGAKRDLLQDAIAFVKKSVTDFPLQFGNFRD